MNRIFLFLSIFCFPLLTFCQFGGKLTYSGKNEKLSETYHLDIFIKKGLNRMDVFSQSPEVSSNYSLVSHLSYDNCFIFSEDRLSQGSIEVPKGVILSKNPSPFHALPMKGNKEKLIAGIKSTHYTFGGNELRAEVYIGEIKGLSSASFSTEIHFDGLMPIIRANNISGIPLEYVIYNMEGEVQSSMQLVAIELADLSENVFNYPPVPTK